MEFVGKLLTIFNLISLRFFDTFSLMASHKFSSLSLTFTIFSTHTIKLSQLSLLSLSLRTRHIYSHSSTSHIQTKISQILSILPPPNHHSKKYQKKSLDEKYHPIIHNKKSLQFNSTEKAYTDLPRDFQEKLKSLNGLLDFFFMNRGK